MGEIAPPETTNLLATFVDDCIKAAISGGDIALEAYLTVQLPFLAQPQLQWIMDQIIGAIGTSIYKNVANVANKIVFDIQTNGENSVVVQASQAAQAAQSSGDPNAIATTTATLVNAIGNLVHSDGTATP